MIGPRYMGSSPTLKRQLSRLSSSSSIQLRAPQGSKLSPLDSRKSDEGIVPEQSWWNTNDGRNLLNLVTGKERTIERSKLGRKMGAVRFLKDDEEEDSSDEDVDVGDEMEDDEDDGADQQALFDIDVDNRMLEEEAEDFEDPDVVLAGMSADDDTEDSAELPTNEAFRNSGRKISDNIVSAVSADKQGGAGVDSAKSVGVDLVHNKKDSSIPIDHDKEGLVRHESKQDDKRIELNTFPDRALGIKSSRQGQEMVGSLQGFEKDLVKGLEKKGSFFWDNAVGIKSRSLENVKSSSGEETKDYAAVVKSGGKVDAKPVATGDGGAAKVSMQHSKGFKIFVESWKERFTSDDELIDGNVQQRLEGVREIEDALLLNRDGAAKSTISKKLDALLRKGSRGSFDHMNPTGNPMLQDPDTPPGTWMTKTDKEMLRAIRGDLSSGGQQPKALLRDNILDVSTVADSAVRGQASTR